MRNDKHLAIQLRKKGLSYQKISNKLDIPKSTLSNWLSDKEWSQEIKEELTEKSHNPSDEAIKAMVEANKMKWRKWREKHREKAREEFSQLMNQPLFVAGIMLYWGEGDKNVENGKVDLGNTDPEMIRIFSLFLQQICEVPKEKIGVFLILYPDLNEKECKEFWSEASGIPLNQFIKTQFIEGRHPTRRLPHGICRIYTCSRGLKEKMFTWLKLFYKQY